MHLLTNGSRFTDKTIEEIFRTKLDELLISLNTPEKALHEAQRGTSMPYEAYMAGIRRMVVEAVRRGPPPKVLVQILYEPTRTDHPDEIKRVNALSNEWANLVAETKGFWNELKATNPRCVRCPIRHWDLEKLYRTHKMK